MLRPLSLLPALVAVAATAWVGVSTPAAAESARTTKAVADDVAPLAVTIDDLSPAAVPERGRITVHGSVTNQSDDPWTAINLYPFISPEPLTTRAEIAEAALTDPTVYLGDRIRADGVPYDTIDELQPGETRPYTVSVRAQDLGADDNGVYWFGIHALGESVDGRVDGTDGRARTFLPRFGGNGGRQVKTALVVPLRTGIEYDEDGSLDDPGTWATDLSADGELGQVVGLGAAAGTRPLTWLVDPAITDAAGRLAAANPPRELGATLDPEATEDPDLAATQTEEPVPTPTAEPTAALPGAEGSTDPGTDDGGGGDQPVDEPTADEIAAAEAATTWLDDLLDVLDSSRSEVLALPYGDLDVAAAAAHDPPRYLQARQRSGATLQPWGLKNTPVLSGPRGYLSPRTIALAGDDETLIASDLMVPELSTKAPTVASVDGHRLVLASSGAASGGPGPDDRLAGVAVRQRILAEAAVRRLSRPRDPLVVVLPTGWVPDDAEGFFEGLDQDWIDLTTVDEVIDEPASSLDTDQLDYPRAQARHELDAGAFDDADDLTRAGSTLQNLLTRNDTVGLEVADQAATTLSYGHRSDVAETASATTRSLSAIGSTLSGVRIDGPSQVTLSSASGRFAATLENTLDEPVTVRVRALAEEPDITITMAEQDVLLPPRSRRSVLLTAATEQQGVHNVTLQVTDLAGTALGGSDGVKIRAAQVSQIIWVIIATGAALLFGAIGVRLVRRVRRARRTPGDAAPQADDEHASTTEQAPTPA